MSVVSSKNSSFWFSLFSFVFTFNSCLKIDLIRKIYREHNCKYKSYKFWTSSLYENEVIDWTKQKVPYLILHSIIQVFILCFFVLNEIEIGKYFEWEQSLRIILQATVCYKELLINMGSSRNETVKLSYHLRIENCRMHLLRTET